MVEVWKHQKGTEYCNPRYCACAPRVNDTRGSYTQQRHTKLCTWHHMVVLHVTQSLYLCLATDRYSDGFVYHNSNGLSTLRSLQMCLRYISVLVASVCPHGTVY